MCDRQRAGRLRPSNALVPKVPKPLPGSLSRSCLTQLTNMDHEQIGQTKTLDPGSHQRKTKLLTSLQVTKLLSIWFYTYPQRLKAASHAKEFVWVPMPPGCTHAKEHAQWVCMSSAFDIYEKITWFELRTTYLDVWTLRLCQQKELLHCPEHRLRVLRVAQPLKDLRLDHLSSSASSP